MEDRQRVQDLIAADIISEHTVHEDDDHQYPFAGARPGPVQKELALQLRCGRCGQGPGQRCLSARGTPCEPHKARFDAVDSPPPGG